VMDNWAWAVCPALPSSLLKTNEVDKNDRTLPSCILTDGFESRSMPSSDLDRS
jgi:hypothetical protein